MFERSVANMAMLAPPSRDNGQAPAAVESPHRSGPFSDEPQRSGTPRALVADRTLPMQYLPWPARMAGAAVDDVGCPDSGWPTSPVP